MISLVALLFVGCGRAQEQLTYNVLIAGYGPWSKHPSNPAAAVAERLDNTCQPMRFSRICFAGWNLTVDHAGAAEVQRALEIGQLQRVGIDGIVTLGLEDSAKGLAIELAGLNVLADADEPIDRAQPLTAVAPPTVDLSRLNIVEAFEPVALVSAETNPAWSRDAGTYYCNEALYRTASTIRRLNVTHPRDSSILLPFVFVHLPPSVSIDVLAPSIASLAEALLVDVLSR